MASSPPDSRSPAHAQATTDTAFALQELTACWDQAYEAMTHGDLERVTVLLELAEAHARAAGDGGADGPDEAALRSGAFTAQGRLRHAMQAGLTGLRDELAQTRHGHRALRGYHVGERPIGGTLSRDC